MTEHTIPADKIQDILTGIINGVYEVGAGRGVSGIAEDLRALLPTPKPRTLTDMTPEEREACRWMQCEESHAPTGGTKARGVILSSDGGSSSILERSGNVVLWPDHLVVPLLDEPPLKWPASAPVTEDTPKSRDQALTDAPAKLVTEEDYRNAPTGTVVWGRGPSSDPECAALEKYGDIWLESGSYNRLTPLNMAYAGPHEVLRRGMGGVS